LGLHVLVKELAPVGAELLQEGELVAWTAELAEMGGAIDIGRELIGDELGNLRIIIPGRRDGERLAELLLVSRFQLRIVEYVLAAILSRIRSPVTSRSNWAKDKRTFRVNRPMLVVVLNAWVTETNDT
jgi:hypothetical protein